MAERVRSNRPVRGRLATIVVVAGLVATACMTPPPSDTGGGSVDLDLLNRPSLADADARVGHVAPTTAQIGEASGLGAAVRWNRYGTPSSLIRYGGYLASGLSGAPATVARSFVQAHRGLFRLSTSDVSALEVVNDATLTGTAAHAVLLRQRFGSLRAGEDGLIAVGVLGDKVVYVSSSASGTGTAPAAATLSVRQAWQKAAANVGRTVGSGDLGATKANHGWSEFPVKGFGQLQRGRLVALPVPGDVPRAAYEIDVVDLRAGAPLAVIAFVDARSGVVLVRHNSVDQAYANQTFSGAFTPGPPAVCGPKTPITVAAGTKSIVVTASATVPANDILLNVYAPNGTLAGSSDQATSPEAVAVTNNVVAGIYQVQVCPSPAPAGPFVPPYTYAGTFTTGDATTPSGVPYPPKWKIFHNFPPTYAATDTRSTDCWQNQTGFPATPVPGCTGRPLTNTAARAPFDVDPRTGLPTFTTIGNAAVTGEAWLSPLTPAEQYRPVSNTRDYSFPFQDKWRTSKCNPTNVLVPKGNDIDAAVTNLFVGHNRFHDFSYYLGFTETNYNAQLSNFGNQATGGLSPNGGEGDPELGNVQAGAVTGGTPSDLGRDNANQIALQDGVPGITNQYLFQPIAGAFYSPCVDGDFDTTVFGHEYTHLISNRMVGGPDVNISGAQGGAMGESWSDQTALEYLNEYGYFAEPGHTQDNPFVEGHYVTGNATTGIRDYALDKNPLNYSDIGFDIPGPEVHADGEIWNAVGTDIRLALTKKYDSTFPSSNRQLQLDCADGKLLPDRCPGNRRFIQIQFDAFLLQQGATSMLDARDAYLAADMMRFGGANQTQLWHAFAARGMGEHASTVDTDDTDPKPDFTSPRETEGSVVVSAHDFSVAARPAVPVTLYVGDYSARVTPIADTYSSTPLGASFTMVPGTYHFVARAQGYGLIRFTRTITAGTTLGIGLHLTPNWAAASRGATATGTGGNFAKLIDENEGTNYAALNQATTVDVGKPSVTVKLAGGKHLVRSVKVSALLRPADANDAYDPGGQNRFTALRRFAIETCTASATNPGCANPVGFTRIYTSPADAFPSTLPRPLAPDLLLSTFDVPDTEATHVRLVVLQNQCTGTPAYAGEQDNDPLNATDCKTASAQGMTVRAAELEVFSFDQSTRPPGDPVVALAATGPTTLARAATGTYTFTYSNAGPQPAAGAVLTDRLPAGVSLVSAPGATYDPQRRTLTWALGDIAVTFTGQRQAVVRVDAGTAVGTALVQQADLTAAATLAPPALVTTIVS